MTIWAFNKCDESETREMVCGAVRHGKSRFGWSQKDEHDLRIKDNWTEHHSRQLFLLQIRPGDWIVHINTPEWGKCIAARVTSAYGFDSGLQCSWGSDFRHCFDVDAQSVTEFDRRDPNVLPTVNLNPRQRFHRVYAETDFLESIENIRNSTVGLRGGQSREDFHIKKKASACLSGLAQLIHNINKSKNLERFLAQVFERIPGVTDVIRNGFGWGTDYGADLIVTVKASIGNIGYEHKIIVQVKSYTGEHYDLEAVSQIKTGIERFDGTAGMLITTASKTEQLEEEVQAVSREIDRPIDIIAGDDVARFVIRHAPEMLFEMNGVG